MPASYEKTSSRLVESLNLQRKPISVSFCDEVPEGVAVFAGRVPGGCRFWQEALQGAFATKTADHEMCSIGVHTHQLRGASGRAREELGATLKVMAGMNYVREEDVGGIPVMKSPSSHVVYGPLAGAVLPPSVVILFAHARQGLILAEAIERVEGGAPAAMGRPACAVIPQSVNSGRAALSLGCCGARAYLDELSDDTSIWALPGDNLEAYVVEIESFARANRTLGQFHALRRRDVEAGLEPTLKASLDRLQA